MRFIVAFFFVSLLRAADISPGAGWSGATADPGAQGDSGSPYYNLRATGRWGTIPFQTVTTTMAVGVFAFHPSGIAKVSFAVNNGTWVDVTTTSTDADSGKQWYTVNVDSSDFSDGDVLEVRAIVYPNIGECRVLGGALAANGLTGEHSLYLTANNGGTLPSLARYVSPTGSDSNDGLTSGTPFLTLYKAAYDIFQTNGSDAGDADGGIIYLTAGSHSVVSAVNESTTLNRWLAVKPAPGLTKADVTITGSTGSGLYNKLVKFEDLTITGQIDSGGPLVDYIWLHNCRVIGTGQDVGYVTSYTSWTGSFITSSTIEDSSNGAIDFWMVRNVDVDGVGGDCFSNSKLVVNCTDQNHDPLTQWGNYHPDVYQSVGSSENVILYGITAQTGIGRTSGLRFNTPPTCISVIDVSIHEDAPWEMDNGYTGVYVLRGSLNVYFGGSLTAEDVVFENVTFTGAGNPGAYSGVTYVNSSSVQVTNFSVGTFNVP